jgi:hypothetical protein
MRAWPINKRWARYVSPSAGSSDPSSSGLGREDGPTVLSLLGVSLISWSSSGLLMLSVTISGLSVAAPEHPADPGESDR